VIDPHSAERSIGRPGIGVNGGFSGLNRSLNKRSQHLGRCTGYHGKAKGAGCTAPPLDNNGDSGLARPTTVSPFAMPADIGLVGFDLPS
jgi:hypothetical protein